MIKFIGYHTTSSESAKNIVTKGFDLSKTKPRTDHWLGIGFYFFEHLADAESWGKTTYYCTDPTIISCLLECDEASYLNLDDPKAYNDFTMYFMEYLKFIKKSNTLKFTSSKDWMHLGLTYYKEDKGILLIKRTFSNSRTSKALKYGFLGYNMQYGYNEVQLCATSDNIIYNRKCLGGTTC